MSSFLLEEIMKILVYEWNTFTGVDILEEIRRRGISYRLIYHNYSRDDDLTEISETIEKALAEDLYDFVFSVNFLSFLAKLCYRKGIKYVSWSYDNPLDVIDIDEVLGLETNYVFLYDRIQAEGYIKRGYRNIYHLPLAVDTNRLKSIISSQTDLDKYGAQVSFVGSLYDSNLNVYMSAMTDYQKGYIEAICKSQVDLYGAYLLDKSISDSFITQINDHYEEVLRDTDNRDFRINKPALVYAMAAGVTREERLILLSMLSNHFDVKLYSKRNDLKTRPINFMGTCDYHEEMPKVFGASDINLNISLKAIQSGIPQRILDIIGCNGFVITNYQPELADYFRFGEDIVVYESFQDAYDKVKYYLNHADQRKQIADNAFRIVQQHFTYESRMDAILRIVEE